MSYTAKDHVIAALRGFLGGHDWSGGAIDTSVKAAVESMFEREYHLEKAVDGASSATTADTTFARVKRASRVQRAYYMPRGALAATATSYATLTINQKLEDDNISTAAAVASADTNSADAGVAMADGVPWELTVSDSIIPAGSTLSVAIAKASAGVIVPAGAWCIELVDA
jgi:hypothetical protein